MRYIPGRLRTGFSVLLGVFMMMALLGHALPAMAQDEEEAGDQSPAAQDSGQQIPDDDADDNGTDDDADDNGTDDDADDNGTDDDADDTGTEDDVDDNGDDDRDEPEEGNQFPAEQDPGQQVPDDAGEGDDDAVDEGDDNGEADEDPDLAPLPPAVDDEDDAENDDTDDDMNNDGAWSPSSEECNMLGLINDYRAQNGLGPLTLTQTLGDASEFHSEDMAFNDSFSHDLSDGTPWQENLYNNGYPENTAIGENIAAGNPGANATFEQWVNSPEHNEIMLTDDYNAIGIGLVTDDSSQYGSYWTADFGSEVDAPVSCS